MDFKSGGEPAFPTCECESVERADHIRRFGRRVCSRSQFQIPNPKSQIPNPKSQIPNPKSQIPNPKSQIPNPSTSSLRKSGYLSTIQFRNLNLRIFSAYKKIDGVHYVVHAVPDHTPFVPERHAYHLGCSH
ncbi:MAG: hypothetical protein DMF63_05650 [Acidobacteria bacterium]|nr:MAG: hypothetical protein DMF63_05650 [Acidobacteriota bacterium]